MVTSVINFVDDGDEEVLISRLVKEGYKIYLCKNISSIQSFFIWAKHNLPLDPPISGKINYDSFIDSFRGGLYDDCNDKYAIIMLGVENILINEEQSFVMLLDCFRDIALDLTIVRDEGDRSVTLGVYILGNWIFEQ